MANMARIIKKQSVVIVVVVAVLLLAFDVNLMKVMLMKPETMLIISTAACV